MLRLIAVLCAALALQGCLARAAVGVVTAPVKVVSKGADLATTSQSEADEKRGREIRKREEKLGQLGRQYDRAKRACDNGDAAACRNAAAIRAEMEELMPGVPVER